MLTRHFLRIGALMSRSKGSVARVGTMTVPPRLIARTLAILPVLSVAVTVGVLTPTPGTAQSLVLSPRASVMGGDVGAWSTGLRAEVGSSTIALFGQFGWFGASHDCLLSAPPSCTTPSSGGLELLGGVRLALPRLGPVRPAISLGAGAMIWNNDGPFESGTGSVWEAELRLGIRAFSWGDLLLGGTVKSVGQSVSGGIGLARDRGTYGGVVVGLLIPVM